MRELLILNVTGLRSIYRRTIEEVQQVIQNWVSDMDLISRRATLEKIRAVVEQLSGIEGLDLKRLEDQVQSTHYSDQIRKFNSTENLGGLLEFVAAEIEDIAKGDLSDRIDQVQDIIDRLYRTDMIVRLANMELGVAESLYGDIAELGKVVANMNRVGTALDKQRLALKAAAVLMDELLLKSAAEAKQLKRKIADAELRLSLYKEEKERELAGLAKLSAAEKKTLIKQWECKRLEFEVQIESFRAEIDRIKAQNEANKKEATKTEKAKLWQSLRTGSLASLKTVSEMLRYVLIREDLVEATKYLNKLHQIDNLDHLKEIIPAMETAFYKAYTQKRFDFLIKAAYSAPGDKPRFLLRKLVAMAKSHAYTEGLSKASAELKRWEV